MQTIMRLLEPRSRWGIFRRFLFFVFLISLLNFAFARTLGPALPQDNMIYFTVHATLVGGPFVVFFLVVMLFQVRLQRRLSLLSRKDGLTGLNNRRTFLELAALRHKEYDFGILLLLDADNFKAINDRYGHQAGDNCLKSIAYVLRRNTREEDVVGRIGGEEFAIFLSHTSIAQARVIGERFTRPIPFSAGPDAEHLTVTLSVGAVIATQHTPLESMFTKADQALYRAKSEGRARMIFAAEVITSHSAASIAWG